MQGVLDQGFITRAEKLLLKVQSAQQLDPELSSAMADLAKAYAALRSD